MSVRFLASILAALSLVAPGEALAQYDSAPTELDCSVMPCEAVLPGAELFEPDTERPFSTGFDSNGDPVGWIVLSTAAVDIPAYSGRPLATLVGLDSNGVIVGARVVHHSEPILLVGIPESSLHDFVDEYVGFRAVDHVVVGHSSDPDAISVDVISGATVTALAQNQTILRSARAVGAMVGVVNLAEVSPGHFIEEEAPWSWDRMQDEGVWGHLVVTNREMGHDRDEPFVDLIFAIIDVPQLGRPLLGNGRYEHVRELMEPGQHLLIILNRGTSSFKGSAFVRGGIFDRVRVEQGFTEVTFRDTDYWNVSSPRLPGAPVFTEGAVFITRGGFIDPGQPFELVFLASRYTGQGGFDREFQTFQATHQVPESIYVVDRSADDRIWVQAWTNRRVTVLIVGFHLLLIIAIFVARRWTTGYGPRLRRLHLTMMALGFGFLGVVYHAQPSVTHMLTLVDSLVREFRWGLFASEPLTFIMWSFIFLTTLYWGRGVFCGWVCPYGAMTELLRVITSKLGIKERELPDKVHNKLRYLRYLILFVLVPIFLYDSVLGEKMAEIEPFKSTFFVPFWTRAWPFALWWLVLAFWSALTFRPFCRYLCPLGAGLALFGSFRFSGPRRREFCSSCKICTRGCEPKAIRPNGTIDARECLSCMECEANFRDDAVCPPLIGLVRLHQKGNESEMSAADRQRLDKLKADAAPK